MFGGPDVVSFLFALMMIFGGGPGSNNDFLDMVQTNAYWQAKGVTVSPEQLQRDASPDKKPENVDALIKALGADDFKTRTEAKAKLEAMGPAIAPQVKPAMESKDPEVAAAATALMKTFTEGGRAREIRRLMAIRTLGERKEKAALPLLKDLTASKELFVAEYAVRAIGQIEGKPVVRANGQKELLGDLKLLPKDTGIVFEAVGMGGQGLSLERLIDEALEAQGGMAPMGMPGAKVPDKKKLMAQMTRQILKGLEVVGNIRVDGIMVGVAKDVGPNGGWVVVSLRGKYDSEAVLAAIKSAGGGDNVKSSKEGTVEVVELLGEGSLLMPSSDQLVLVMGSRGDRLDGVIKDVLAVLNGGKGGAIAENAEMAALMKTVDTSSPVWGVAQINKDMQADKTLEGYDTITLTAKMEKDAASFVFTATGSDAEKVKSSADALTDGIQASIGQLKPMVQQMKPMQAMVDLLESLKVTPKDKTATMTGSMKSNFADAALISAGGYFWLGGMDEEEGAASQPAAEEIVPVPPQ